MYTFEIFNLLVYILVKTKDPFQLNKSLKPTKSQICPPATS